MAIYIRRQHGAFAIEMAGRVVATHLEYRVAEAHAHALAREMHWPVVSILG